MTIYITWPIDDHDTVASKYLSLVGETLAPSDKYDSETHCATGSSRLTAEQQATLEADPDFANVVFSNTPPEGFDASP